VAKLRRLFDAAAHAATGEVLVLVDVSTASDQLGVGVGFESRVAGDHWSIPLSEVVIQGSSLALHARNVRTLMLPPIQWEPVWAPGDPPLPSPLVSFDDGGPALLGVDSVDLVEVAPEPVLEHILSAHRPPAGSPVAALFTLPFGIHAVAQLDAAHPATVALNRPEFDFGPTRPTLTGARQVTLRTDHRVSPEESPTFGGAAYQARNVIGYVHGALELNDVLDQAGSSSMRDLFNDEFGPDATTRRVPVTRLDLAGYGASMFSHWEDPNAAAGASQAHFEVLVGRTAYELIQFRSFVYPYGLRIVRTITIRRSARGRVDRHDTGWVATGPGLFRFPDEGREERDRIHVHPGLIRGVMNVTNIRETSTDITLEGGAALRAVKFDGDLLVRSAGAGAVAPANLPGLPSDTQRVPTRDLWGFALNTHDLLTAGQLAELIARQGGACGGTDCTVTLSAPPARSGHRFRVHGVEVGTAPRPDGSLELAVAARGALALSHDGSWSMIRRPHDSGMPEPVDPTRGAPLVQQGREDAAPGEPPAPYRFLEPADLFHPDDPGLEYGIMHSMDMQRVLFRGPVIQTDPTAPQGITSGARPLIADSFALASAIGPFPAADRCIEIPSDDWQILSVDGTEGAIRLSMPGGDTFTPAPVDPVLATGTTWQYWRQLVNPDRTPSQVTYRVAPGAAGTPDWAFGISGVRAVHRAPPFDEDHEFFGAQFRVDAAAGQATQFKDAKLVLGSVLAPLGALLDFLSQIGIRPPLHAGMTNTTMELEIGLSVPFGPRIWSGPPAGAQTNTWPENELNLGFAKLKDAALEASWRITGILGRRLGVELEASIGGRFAFGTPVEALVYLKLTLTYVAKTGPSRTGAASASGQDSAEWKLRLGAGVGGELIPANLVCKAEGFFVIGGEFYDEDGSLRGSVFFVLDIEFTFCGGLLSLELKMEGTGTVAVVHPDPAMPGNLLLAGCPAIERLPTGRPIPNGADFWVVDVEYAAELTAGWFFKVEVSGQFPIRWFKSSPDGLSYSWRADC
jgi:hypothetical protein